MPTEEYAGDVVLGAGMAKVPFPVGPDHEAVGLADFTTTNRAWAIPAIPSGFHASTETVPIQFQHGAHSNLSVSVRCLILLSTYFIYFFIRMDRWTDMYVEKHPHMRGEDAHSTPYPNPVGETPPHAWGRLENRPINVALPGNTPTCVGKT